MPRTDRKPEPRTRWQLAGAAEMQEELAETWAYLAEAELRDLARKLARKRRARSPTKWVEHITELHQLLITTGLMSAALDLADRGRRDRANRVSKAAEALFA